MKERKKGLEKENIYKERKCKENNHKRQKERKGCREDWKKKERKLGEDLKKERIAKMKIRI